LSSRECFSSFTLQEEKEESGSVFWQDKKVKEIYSRVIAFWWSSGLAYDAPALAFYILISLAPLAIGLSALAEVFFPSTLAPENITNSISVLFPERVAENINDLSRSNNSQTPLLLIVSAFLMFWTVSAALSVVERAESRILLEENTSYLTGRLRMLWLGALFTLVLLLLLASFATRAIPFSFSLLFVPLAFTLLLLLYRFLPKARAPWKRSALGASFATLGFFLVPRIVSLYFTSGFRPSFVGLFAALAVFIVSCYLLAVFLLLGAGIAAKREEDSARAKDEH
jgi:membrane protein